MAILMSVTNPLGHRLEDLLLSLQVEIEAKNARLVNDERPTAQRIVGRNLRIMNLLCMAEELQRETLADLNKIGPDQGPLGPSRLGAGSPGGPPAIHIDKTTR